MAYYTVSKHLQHLRVVPEDRIDPDFFAYCFEGEGDPRELAVRYACSPDDLKAARAEFEYWYPFDVRGSGKDLVQNHLTFCVFNHVALFPGARHPRALEVNGWLKVEGEKMSKSKGNFLTIRDALDAHGADVVRFTLALAGEGIDDPNWDPAVAEGAARRFASWLEFISEYRGRGRADRRAIDDWFESTLEGTLATSRAHYAGYRYRSALNAGYFDLQSQLRWYLRRSGGEPNRDLLDRAMCVQTQLLAPVVPHLAEEAWAALGREPFVALSHLPEPRPESDAARGAMAGERLLVSTIEDIRKILKITRIEPKMVRLFTAPAWKRAVLATALRLMRPEGKLDMGALMKESMADPAVKAHAKAVPAYAQQLVKELPRMAADEAAGPLEVGDEAAYLAENAGFIAREIGCEVAVQSADAQGLVDPGNKAKAAVPGRIAIFVE
jgi:leucyl-tRNA synthetase